jgi:hypothetical protein
MTHIKETEKDNIILKVGHLISSNFSKWYFSQKILLWFFIFWTSY